MTAPVGPVAPGRLPADSPPLKFTPAELAATAGRYKFPEAEAGVVTDPDEGACAHARAIDVTEGGTPDADDANLVAHPTPHSLLEPPNEPPPVTP